MTPEQTTHSISVVIPSYLRGEILLATIEQLRVQAHPCDEIVVVDQTPYPPHDASLKALQALADNRVIVLIRRPKPSIPAAMNAGLQAASSQYVLFLDDDIEIGPDFIKAHYEGLKRNGNVARTIFAQVGQVLQPGQSPQPGRSSSDTQFGLRRDLDFEFNSDQAVTLNNCMAGNLCVHRESAISAGGFDENFIGAAYRFETEFARRLIRHTNTPIYFWPAASINHLQWQDGGTRTQASHLTSAQPAHSAGDYYYAMKEGFGGDRVRYLVRRFFASLVARFYLLKPWYLPVRVIAELRGLLLATRLLRNQPKLLHDNGKLLKNAQRQGGGKMGRRLAVVMSHPTQHFVPVYRALAANKDVQLQVFYLASNGVQATQDPEFGRTVQWDIPMTKGYPHTFVGQNKVLKKFSLTEMDYRQINLALADFQPELVWLHGYASLANWRVVMAKPCNTAIVYTSDSNLADPRKPFRRFWKTAVVKTFFNRCDHFLSISDANRRYLKHYNVDSRKINDAPFPIDMAYWAKARGQLPENSSSRLRQKLSIATDATVFLFAGKLVAHKRAIDVVRAMLEIRHENVHAVIVGSGPEQANLRQELDLHGLDSRVTMVGFINQTELPRYFDACDVLVFPSSREPYGAIAAEVLPFALPIIATDNIGAIGAAIIVGKNALVYKAGEARALAAHMRTLATDENVRRRLGEESKIMAPALDASHMSNAIIKQLLDC